MGTLRDRQEPGAPCREWLEVNTTRLANRGWALKTGGARGVLVWTEQAMIEKNWSTIISASMEDMVVARRYLISGRVQGVGFRFFTEDVARREGVCGFVKNLADGRVEAVGEAEREALERFELRLHQGSSASRVDHVKTEELRPTGHHQDFVVRE